MVVALCLVTALVVMLRQPKTAARVDHVFADGGGQTGGQIRPAASEVVAAEQIAVAPADPAAFRKLLDLAGWDSNRLAAVGDGQPLADGEREQLLDLLRRLRSFDAADLAAWTRNDRSIDTIASHPDAHRGELVPLAGRVTRVTRRTLPPELAARLEMPAYFECDVVLNDDAGTATIITARVPDAWTHIDSLHEPAEAEGVFVRLLPSIGDKPVALFVSPAVAWRPSATHPPYVSFGESVLGSLGMDVGLLDAVQQRQPIRAGERDAFYAMLAAAKQIGTQQLIRLARGHLPAVRAAWTDTAESLAASSIAAEQNQLMLAREVVARADEGKYSVAPLFNQPAEQVGEVVLLDGLARRAVRVDVGTLPDGRPSNVARRFGIDHYYEMEIFTDDSQNNPIVFCATELPAGFPMGESIHEQVRVAGFFFKSWSYESRRAAQPEAVGQAKSAAEARQFAPLVIGRGPVWIQPAATADPNYTAYALAAFFACALAGVWVIGWWLARGDRQFSERMLAKEFTLPPGESLDDLEVPAAKEADDFHRNPD
jgi:hypothetical protein